MDKVQEQLQQINIQLAPLSSLIEDVKSIKSDLCTLRESLDMAHGLISTVANSFKTLEDRVSTVEKIASSIPTLQAEISTLKQELDERDQWARANNVEIRCIPIRKNENLFEIARQIGNLSNISIKKEDINYIARIPTRVPNTEKPIIISFINRYIKEDFVASARKSKKLNISYLGFSANSNFYVNDHLTQRNKSLLNKARSIAKEKNFKYIWVKNSKIMARKSDTSHTFFIRCENDLVKIS